MTQYNTVPFRSKKYQRQQELQKNTDIVRIANQWIMRRDQLPEYRFAIELMSQKDREEMFWTTWDLLDCFAQRDLARAAFGDCWFKLIADYSDFQLPQKVQALEALGYIHNQNVVNFLVQELRREDESLRIAAAGALKKQDPILVIEPMLAALNKPEQYLAARIYDVLEALGPKLVPIILSRLHRCSIDAQIVMVQLLGRFGDESVIPALISCLDSDNYLLKKMTVEALSKLQGQDICPILTNLLTDENWQIRLMAAEAIGRGRFTAACPALREAYANEPDNLVKELMQEILHTIDTNNDTITYLWTRQRSSTTYERQRNNWRSDRSDYKQS